MAILIEWVLQPLGLVTGALMLTLLSWCVNGAKPRIPFVLFCLSAAMLIAFSMPSISNALVWRVENARTNSSECISSPPPSMVVLGGGIDLYVPDNSPYEVLNSDSLIRTSRAPEFASANSHYYLLGGGNSERTLAKSMQQVLVAQGIHPDNITTENKSTSTHENAQALTTLLPPSDTPRINLLTSMLHVKRAAATFEKNGYTVCHIGVDTLYSVPKMPVSLLPYLAGLNKSTLVFHEWLALTVYRIKGYL